MKVLSQEKWSAQVTCTACKALLEIEESDLRVVNTAMAYAGERWDPRLRVECAVCHSDIDVTRTVPSGMRYRMYDEAREKMDTL